MRIRRYWPLLLFVSVFCLALDNHADTLARNGQIDNHASVKATSEILISASPDKVWSLLAGIDDWPKWQPDISSAKLAGSLERGTSFTWSAGKVRITSRLALVKPVEELAWTGTAMHATAIHVWQLRPALHGGTLVDTKESMNGFMLKVLYSSKDLKKSQESWLSALKREAER